MANKLKLLHPNEYRHPFDTKALEALEKTPGVSAIVKKLYDWGLEKFLLQQFLGQSLRMSPKNFPAVHATFETACQILDFKDRPQLYVMREQGLSCTTLGVTKPIIVIGTSCIDLFNEDELLFVMGREIGHIQNAHVKYLEIAKILPVVSNALSDVTLGLGKLMASGFQFAMIEWQRATNYTADRAGLLACQNIEAAIRVLVQEAGLPSSYDPSTVLEDFKAQSTEFGQINQDLWMKFSKYLSHSNSWEVARAQQLYQWAESKEYRNVLERTTKLPGSSVFMFCPGCGLKVLNLHMFCGNCGRKLIA